MQNPHRLRRATNRWPGASISRTLAILFLLLIDSICMHAYSVLTHEEIIDLLWDDQLQPLLLSHYPGLTEDQLRQAHAYAYGGAVIQDLGYYPFGSREFSDLVHYVRSGDFVFELLNESQNAYEYAFALGALSHYAADMAGHPAVNQAVAICYPKLRAKFGPIVLYAQDTTAHIRTEFGFDMAQVARRRYAPQQYHDFIGFNVSKELLERVFPVIYGLQLKDVLPHEDLAIGSFRYAVSTMIPKMTQVALRTHKDEITREVPNFQKEKFLYRLSRADYEKEWGKTYQKPGFGTRFLAALLHIVPKVGPLKALNFTAATPKTENMYFASINLTVDNYRSFLKAERATIIRLPDGDLDSGKATAAGEYILADDTYAKLLSRLAEGKFNHTSALLQKNILAFYADPSAPIDTKKDPARWQQVQTNIEALRAFAPNPELPALPQSQSALQPGSHASVRLRK